MKTDFSLSELTLLDRAVRQRRRWLERSIDFTKTVDKLTGTKVPGYRLDAIKELDNLHDKLDNYKRKARREESSEYQERTGEEGLSADGKKIRIVKYINSKNITVEFEDGQVLHRQNYSKFRNQKIMSKRAYEDSKK